MDIQGKTNFGPPSIVIDGLTLYLDAANPKSYTGSGVNWGDLSGYRNDGTLVNGIYFDNNMIFNNSGHVDCGDDSSLSSTSITIDTWVNWSSLTSYKSIITRWSSASSEQLFFLTNYSGTGKLDFYINNGSVKNIRSISDEVVINTWYNIVGLYDEISGDFKIYKNGDEVITNTVITSGSLQTVSTSIVGIGKDINRNIYPFEGSMSNLKIYNRALSQNELIQNYNAIKRRFI